MAGIVAQISQELHSHNQHTTVCGPNMEGDVLPQLLQLPYIHL